MKIYVIGHEDAVIGLGLVGVHGFPTADPEEALRIINQLADQEGVGVILVTTDIARGIRLQMEKLEQEISTPIVLEIPAPGQPLERPSARALVGKAVGVQL